MLAVGFNLAFSIVQDASAQNATVYKGATLVDSTREAPLENAVIIVRDGRIETVGDSAQTAIPKDADIIDISGHWVTPGLICLLYTSPSPRDRTRSRMPSSA